GRAADAICRRLHPEPYRTYNIDRNINYTNVCAAVCDFCAFYRKSGDADAYVLPREVLYQKIEETIKLGGDQILLQGGNHPSLPLEGFRETLAGPPPRFPRVNLHRLRRSGILPLHQADKAPAGRRPARPKGRGIGRSAGGGGRDPHHPFPQEVPVNKVL